MPTSRVARMSEIETFNEQELLQEARARGAQPLAGREGASRYGAAAALVVVAVGLWIAAPPAGVDVPLLAALIVGLACASRIEFEFGPVYTAPLQLVVVPLLLLFPPAVALPAVAAGLVLSLLPDVLRGHTHPDRLIWSGCVWPRRTVGQQREDQAGGDTRKAGSGRGGEQQRDDHELESAV